MEKFARKCSITEKGMNDGWIVGDGDLYLSELDLAENWAKENGTTLKQAYKDGLIYWTEWEVDEDDEWYDEDGKLYGMSLNKTQLQIQKEIAESTGYITVTCGNCGDVHFQESKELVYTCPLCAYEGDPCNFPDLYS